MSYNEAEVYNLIMRFKIPEPVSGGLFLTYKCSASCGHCMYACSPKWSADWISREDLHLILNGLTGKIQPSPYGPDHMSLNHGLHFTGGEPFLNFELLCDAVEMAEALGIPSTFVETNCYWASSNEVAREKLFLLKSKGLKGIMISVNPFYLEYVPFERTELASLVSREVFGRNVMVYQVEYYRKFKRHGIKGTLPFDEYLRLEWGEEFARTTEFFIMGRAAYTIGAYDLFPRYSANLLLDEPCRPPFLRNWHNHFDNYGNYVPGYCGGITLGDCRKLDRLLEVGIDPEEKPVLACLVRNDFQGLLKLAGELGYREDTEGYLSKCHLCVDIRRKLAERNDYRELEPKAFYSNLT